MTPKVRVQHTSLLFSTSDTWSVWNQVTWMVFYWGGFWWKDLDKLHSLLVFSQMLKDWRDSTSWCKWILTKHFVKVTQEFFIEKKLTQHSSFLVFLIFTNFSYSVHFSFISPQHTGTRHKHIYSHMHKHFFSTLLYKFAISHNDIAKFCNLEYLWCWNTGRDSKHLPHK